MLENNFQNTIKAVGPKRTHNSGLKSIPINYGGEVISLPAVGIIEDHLLNESALPLKPGRFIPRGAAPADQIHLINLKSACIMGGVGNQ